MGTARGDMPPTVSSSKLHQKQASDILNRVEDVVKLEPDDGNCLLESNQERTPCINIIPKKELDTLSRKQNPEGNQTLILSESSLTIKGEPFDLHERQSSDAGHDVSESNELERTYACKSVNDSENSSADPGFPAQESNHNHVCRLTVLENILEKLQQMQNVENGGCSSKKLDQESTISNASENSPIIPKNECDESVREGEKYTILRKEVVLENQQHIPSLSVEVPISEFDIQKCTNKAEKLQPRRNPNPGVRSKLLEKGLLDDGYNWRKYGQKFIKKRNLLIRSYYKCTYPICEAKKQVEKLHDVYYFGEHRHPKTQECPKVASSFQARTREIPILTVSGADAELIIARADVHQHIGVNVVSLSNGDLTDKDDIPDSKRQKSETNVGDHNKANNDSLRVVETLSDVDVVNDGFRWRKYGQKFVKGSPNPRSYYRCSTNAGCRAKKHVERSASNPKAVITTYEGEHDHDVPPCTTNN